MQCRAQLVNRGCKREKNVVFRIDNCKSTRSTCTLTHFYHVSEALKTTTDGAVSQKSNEIHLKLNDCQLNRYFVDTSGLLATWPEFWAIGLSFLGLNS